LFSSDLVLLSELLRAIAPSRRLFFPEGLLRA
jgi:hypothetical protein